MKKFNLKKAAQHAYKVCKAREAVIQAAKAWFPSDTRGFKWIPLQEAVRKLIKLESKGAKDGKTDKV